MPSSYLTQLSSTVTLLFNTPLAESIEQPKEFQLKEMPSLKNGRSWRHSQQIKVIQDQDLPSRCSSVRESPALEKR
ncbi:hypothetical protein VKT23_005908 [Stygiomarasmius scandens]|uniref:Uncharacterized protein n=1 Tax=Marasmiellus scandens TaxID=2682957 RepID=A0ABR1JUH7_9AGAR